MLYQPKLNNGEVVPLSWPIALYRVCNTVCWPLGENASNLARIFSCFCWILGFLVAVQHWEAEIRFLRANISNIDQVLSGVPTITVLMETWLRGFPLGLTQTRWRGFMNRFYSEIYISESTQPQLFKKIRRSLRPAFVVALLYIATWSSYLSVLLMHLVTQSRETLYKMIYPFDITPIYIYLPIILSNLWIANFVASFQFGQDNIISEVIQHLNGRFLLLQEDMELRIKRVLEGNDNSLLAKEFRLEIIEIIKQNVDLNRFAADFQKEFSYRIFVMFGFSAVLLCGLSFKVYTNPADSIAYLFWVFAKITEMLVIGQVGSTIITTTDKVSSMYYESNWELAIFRSSDKCENVKLMKLITLAIELNMKPFYLTGLNFFSVSLASVLKILQGAGSYFTCLISLR